MSFVPHDDSATGPRHNAGYVPVDARGFRLAMGLRPLQLAQWLEIDDEGDQQIALKGELLRTHYHEVVALSESEHPAYDELLDEVIDNLREFHPERDREIDAAAHPLVAASVLVAEDFCVLVRENARWKLLGAVVCFPSRWSLADKIGTDLDEIHAPVPGYAQQLSAPTQSFFDRLSAQRSFWRLNWTLLNDATLFQPRSPGGPCDDNAENWQFRVERQTLRLLARSNGAVFTIRTSVRPASQLVSHVPNFARDVLGYLESAPRETLDYKGWTGLAQRWAKWYAEEINRPDTRPATES